MILLPLLLSCTALLGVAEHEPREEYPVLLHPGASEVAPDPADLRIMTWNLKYGGGRIDFWFDGWGDRVHMERAEVLGHMDALLSYVEWVDPDVLLVQEADRGSARSAWVDEVRWILERSDFNHAAAVPVWEADFIPDQGLGRMNMTQAVFSKHRITRNTRVDLGPVASQGSMERAFHPTRCVQRVEIDLGHRMLTVLNVQLEPPSSDGTLERQVLQVLDEAAQVGGEMVLGGDFQALPPGAPRRSGFADVHARLYERGYERPDYEAQPADLLLPFFESARAAVPLEVFLDSDEDALAELHTVSLSAAVPWSRTVDYLFGSGAWDEARVGESSGDPMGPEPMALSDHAPLVGRMRLP